MSSSTNETLVRMANQIADFFKIQPANEAVAGTADHIRRFWDPRMRTENGGTIWRMAARG